MGGALKIPRSKVNDREIEMQLFGEKKRGGKETLLMNYARMHVCRKKGRLACRDETCRGKAMIQNGKRDVILFLLG